MGTPSLFSLEKKQKGEHFSTITTPAGFFPIIFGHGQRSGSGKTIQARRKIMPFFPILLVLHLCDEVIVVDQLWRNDTSFCPVINKTWNGGRLKNQSTRMYLGHSGKKKFFWGRSVELYARADSF